MKNINIGLTELKNAINRKEIHDNENPENSQYCWRNHGFNKQQKGKRIKILTPKQMLQRLVMQCAKVKAGNTSKNLLNEIRQIIYSL